MTCTNCNCKNCPDDCDCTACSSVECECNRMDAPQPQDDFGYKRKS